MNKSTYILLFAVSKFNRQVLDHMSQDELYDLMFRHSYDETRGYKVNDFCTLCNDQEIDNDKWWMYTVTK